MRLLRMASSLDPDQAAENGKQCRRWSLLRMVNSVDPNQTVLENDSVDLDVDQTAENGK